MAIDPWYFANLVCPRDRSSLHQVGPDRLRCEDGHLYPVVQDLPVMLVSGRPQTIDIAKASLDRAHDAGDDDDWHVESVGVPPALRPAILRMARSGQSPIDPVVSYLIASTNGMAYTHLVGRLCEYPIPTPRLPPGQGRRLLDIGCSWGRWSIANARLGYDVVGIDPSLGAVLAAVRVARALGVQAHFVVGDGRALPFRADTFDSVFSYSVIQHFSKADATAAVGEIGRVVRPGGDSLVQMPTMFGVRCLYHQARRGFREPRAFEVRYYTRPELRRLFTHGIGPTDLEVDCFFGLGLQPGDRHLLPWQRRMVLDGSEMLKRLAGVLRPIGWVADSVYVRSRRPGTSVNLAA